MKTKTLLTIALAMLATGCCTRDLKREYQRGYNEGFEECFRTFEEAEYLGKMRKWVRGQGERPELPKKK